MEEHIEHTFYEERRHYRPLLPKILQNIHQLEAFAGPPMHIDTEIEEFFPRSKELSQQHFKLSDRKHKEPLRIGVVLSGGQAPGGHNVIIGLFEALQKIHIDSKLFGFLNGPAGLINHEYDELHQKRLSLFRNTGGFDLLGSGRTKIETEQQFEAVRAQCSNLKLDGLVVIGGDDSNTNAAFLAEYFKKCHLSTSVVGIPKTIDGDLKNSLIESSFGFDTACKVYSEMIGNICRDALSAKKYTHFVKLMGRSASHIALECALQTHPNCTLIGEEIAARRMTLMQMIDSLCAMIISRAEKKKNFGVILIPEGLIEFIPEMKVLIQEINALLIDQPQDLVSHLSKEAKQTFSCLPKEIGEQLLFERDPHGNVLVSQIATEQLLIQMVQKELLAKKFKGKFTPVGHFFGYEGRCAYPSNFDANYCYALGFTAIALIQARMSGYMSCLQKLNEPAVQWEPIGIPLASLMHLEERKGKKKAVVKKALVDLQGQPFKFFAHHRAQWAENDDYRFPGPIQFFGPPSLSDALTLTLQLEHNQFVHH